VERREHRGVMALLQRQAAAQEVRRQAALQSGAGVFEMDGRHAGIVLGRWAGLVPNRLGTWALL
jgi:hypothetical protein